MAAKITGTFEINNYSYPTIIHIHLMQLPLVELVDKI
jgi:hypothetical protein